MLQLRAKGCKVISEAALGPCIMRSCERLIVGLAQVRNLLTRSRSYVGPGVHDVSSYQSV